MIVAAVLCPGPPLFFPELSGADPDAARMREAAVTAVGDLIARRPELVAVVGPGPTRRVWPAGARADLTAYGGLGLRRPDATCPLSVGVGATLLDMAGHHGERLMWTVSADDHRLDIADAASRVGLLAIVDGSARRTLKAPGYLDERAGPYDAQVRRSVSTSDFAGLRGIDPGLADELMAPGWPVLQVLADAFEGVTTTSTVHYDDAPFGVGYLVASVVRGPSP